MDQRAEQFAGLHQCGGIGSRRITIFGSHLHAAYRHSHPPYLIVLAFHSEERMDRPGLPVVSGLNAGLLCSEWRLDGNWPLVTHRELQSESLYEFPHWDYSYRRRCIRIQLISIEHLFFQTFYQPLLSCTN